MGCGIISRPTTASNAACFDKYLHINVNVLLIHLIWVLSSITETTLKAAANLTKFHFLFRAPEVGVIRILPHVPYMGVS